MDSILIYQAILSYCGIRFRFEKYDFKNAMKTILKQFWNVKGTTQSSALQKQSKSYYSITQKP